MLLQETDFPMETETPIEAEAETETETENCSIEVDEADQAKLDTLTEQESRISTLLKSRQQIQSLKEKYEEKLIQIASQLESLTVLLDFAYNN